MSFQRHLKRTFLTISNQLLEPFRSGAYTDARKFVSSISSLRPSSSNHSSLSVFNFGPKSAANSNHLQNSSQVLVQALYAGEPVSDEPGMRLTQSRPNSVLPLPSYSSRLCNSSSNDSSFKDNLNFLFSGHPGKKAKLPGHISHSTLMSPAPAQSTNNISAVFQCSIPQRPLRTVCGNHIITQKTTFQHYPQHTIACRLKHTKPKVPPTKISQVYDYEGAITDEQAAEEFVFALKTSERQHLYAELAKYQGLDRNGAQTTPPTRKQLQQVVLHQTFPFLGFGFLDNLLMIVAVSTLSID
ncbi:transmembrane protein 65 [Elysia marginata]|uniref:Transmembrane protein 65 n=1 Tax=Elysia marginata TaxID=1093978 RepID=A0AAV4EIV0_9GAST|nr:transmembrane protein 65 [Elysia marginata]